MGFQIQIKLGDNWHSVRKDAKSQPYEYETETEAWNMMNICYPDQVRAQRLGRDKTVRVIHVEDA